MNVDLHDHPRGAPPASVITMERLSTLSLVTLGFALIALGLIALRLAYMPQLTKVFEDFDTELPELTKIVFRVPVFLYYLTCGAALVGLVLKERMLRDKGIALLTNLIATGVFLAVWIAIEYAYLLPLYTLLEAVSR